MPPVGLLGGALGPPGGAGAGQNDIVVLGLAASSIRVVRGDGSIFTLNRNSSSTNVAACLRSAATTTLPDCSSTANPATSSRFGTLVYPPLNETDAACGGYRLAGTAMVLLENGALQKPDPQSFRDPVTAVTWWGDCLALKPLIQRRPFYRLRSLT
jgi:hypothetical protein